MRFLGSILLAVVLLACEGPEGPVGPAGPAGPAGAPGQAGPPGAPAEGILIERSLSASTYDEDGAIIIRDSRITPTTFRALYFKIEYTDQGVGYFTIDSIVDVYSGSLPILGLAEGRLIIWDRDEGLLELARAAFDSDEIVSFGLAVLVSA